MKRYLTNCVEAIGSDIEEMVDNATEINYATLLEHVTQEELDEVFPMYEQTPNLSLESDYSVSFYMGKYLGKECVYVQHSRVEYIFT